MEPKRVIFLDIDGPMIPLRLYVRGDRMRHPNGTFLFDPIGVWMINHLCQETDAQVVFNTAHCENPAEILHIQANTNAIERVHPEIKTKYMTSVNNRANAIMEFVLRHNIKDWTVFDDYDMNLKRQVVVDFDIGITIKDMETAFHHLTGQPVSNKIISFNRHSPG